LTLGFAALRASSLVEAAAAPMQALAGRTGETVNLGVLVGARVLYLHRIRNRDLVTADLQVGSTLPAACASKGKVLLAALSSNEQEQRLRQADFHECRGPRAPSSIEEVRRDLDAVRERGWAIQDQQVAHGIRSVAAPIRGPLGSTVAAINLTVQAARWSVDDLIERFLPSTLQTAEAISRRLGYQSS
jgi:IclR family pca regulon transcriptional regulator